MGRRVKSGKAGTLRPSPKERFRPNMAALVDSGPQATFHPPEARWGDERWSLKTISLLGENLVTRIPHNTPFLQVRQHSGS